MRKPRITKSDKEQLAAEKAEREKMALFSVAQRSVGPMDSVLQPASSSPVASRGPELSKLLE